MAEQRGYEIVQAYTDRISGAKARRPGLDQMMKDARQGRFDVVLVWASDRIARSVKHFLEVLDELSRLNIEFISFREQIDTGGPLGRAIVVIVGAIAELERSLIVERVRAGMRRARLEGQHIGRRPLEIDRAAILRDRQRGQSLGQLARTYQVSRENQGPDLLDPAVPKGVGFVTQGRPNGGADQVSAIRRGWVLRSESPESRLLGRRRFPPNKVRHHPHPPHVAREGSAC